MFRDVNISLKKNDSFVKKNEDEKSKTKRSFFFKVRVFKKGCFQNDRFYKNRISLTIVNDDLLLTIVIAEPLLTIVYDEPSLKIVNDEPSLPIVVNEERKTT